MCFFFNDTAHTVIYTYGHTLSLHDALPIYPRPEGIAGAAGVGRAPVHLRPAQHGADARDQFARVEGFDDIVVGADLQPDDPFGILGARGDRKSTRLNSSH